MINRQMSEWLGRVAREYAVLSIMGPRQSGKTTLARTMFKDYDYARRTRCNGATSAADAWRTRDAWDASLSRVAHSSGLHASHL